MISKRLEYKAADNDGCAPISIGEIVETRIRPLYTEDDFKFERVFENNSKKVYLCIIEDYSFRINSDMTITIIAEEDNGNADVQIIVSGASAGIFGFSYGADESRIDSAVRTFLEYGYKIVY